MLNENGYDVIRFWNSDVLENLEGVMETIRREVAARTTHLTPTLSSLKGGEGE
jgi:very-short-patch-repair endonuclease